MDRIEPGFSDNPYAAPRARVADVATGVGCWREGKRVLLLAHADFPARCVKCDASVRLPVKIRKVYWHHPAWYALIILYLWIYVIAAMVVRKKVRVSPALCSRHTTARWLKIGASFLTLFCAMGLLMEGIAAHSDAVIWTSVVMIFAAIVGAVLFSRIVTPVRITSEFSEFKGFGAAYLDSLPAAGESW